MTHGKITDLGLGNQLAMQKEMQRLEGIETRLLNFYHLSVEISKDGMLSDIERTSAQRDIRNICTLLGYDPSDLDKVQIPVGDANGH